ncbi:MAG: hypothetical protein WCT12_35690 [Verrucomicrobiota bacterium]
MKPLRLAVDTNVLLDLAEGMDAVLDTFALLDQRMPGNDMLIVPSVLDEVAFLCDSGDTVRVRRLVWRAGGSGHEAARRSFDDYSRSS